MKLIALALLFVVFNVDAAKPLTECRRIERGNNRSIVMAGDPVERAIEVLGRPSGSFRGGLYWVKTGHNARIIRVYRDGPKIKKICTELTRR